VDFEPYEAFLTATETAQWWRAWTGNATLDGSAFKVFGQDGAGGMAAFWLTRPQGDITEQPVVFIGSEGEVAVVAGDMDAYLWLLAQGFGPYEAAVFPHHEHALQSDARLVQLARSHAPTARSTPADIIAAAQDRFPDFVAYIEGACR